MTGNKLPSSSEQTERKLKRLPEYEEKYFRLEAESLLRCLLKGGMFTVEEIEDRKRYCRLELTDGFFGVAGVSIDDMTSLYFEKRRKSTDDDMKDATFIIRNILDELIGEGHIHYWLPTDSWNVCIFCLKDEESCEFLRSVAKEFTDYCDATFGLRTSVMVSRPCRGYRAIPEAYGDALALRQFKRILGLPDRVLFFGEQGGNKDDYIFRNEINMTLDFLTAVRQGNFQSALGALNAIIDGLFYAAPPGLECLESHFESLKHLIFIATEDIRRKFGADVELLLRPENTLMHDNVPRLQEKVGEIFHHLISLQQSGAASPPPAWLNEMIRHINANYRRVSLNIATAADLFGLNPSYVSRTFKKYMGIGILDYINGLRVREAKRLITAGHSIGRAAEQVGYGSSMSMRRAFKRYEGCTPSRLQ